MHDLVHSFGNLNSFPKLADQKRSNRRVGNGAQVRRVTQLALTSKPSVDFSRYYQRHLKAAQSKSPGNDLPRPYLWSLAADYSPMATLTSRFTVPLYFVPLYSNLLVRLETKLSVLPSPSGFVSL